MNPQEAKAHFSSNTDEWETPQALFDRLDAEFKFNLDVCATAENAKCPRYFTKEINGLTQPWAGHRVWCNPPYGRAVGDWVKKCYMEAVGGLGTICVALVASRTDTRWWRDYAMRASEIRLIRGRVKFGGGANSAPFPSALLVFGTPTYPRFSVMEL